MSKVHFYDILVTIYLYEKFSPSFITKLSGKNINYYTSHQVFTCCLHTYTSYIKKTQQNYAIKNKNKQSLKK